MKYILKALLPLFAFLFSPLAFSSSCPDSGTIIDYFLSLPLDRLQIVDDETGLIKDVQALEKALATVDLKNGYLELQNKTILSKVTAALFKNKNGSKTVAVVFDGVSVQNVYAFRCEKGQWMEITKIFYPILSIERITRLYHEKNIKISGKAPSAKDLSDVAHTLVRFRLPKQGTTIEAFASHPDLDSKNLLFGFKP